MTPPTALSAAANGLGAARERAAELPTSTESQSLFDPPIGKRLLASSGRHRWGELSSMPPRVINGDAGSLHPPSRSHSRRPPPLGSSTGQHLFADHASHPGYAGGAQLLPPTSAVDHGA